MRERIAFLVVALLVVLAITRIASLWPHPVKLGLDLQGGTHLVYRIYHKNGEPLKEEDVIQTIKVIRNRVDSLGIAEPIIQRKGKDQLIIELPGIKDVAHAKKVIGKTAQLEFRKSYIISTSQPYGRDVAAAYIVVSQKDFEELRLIASKLENNEPLTEQEKKFLDRFLKAKSEALGYKFKPKDLKIHKARNGEWLLLLGETYVTGAHLRRAEAKYGGRTGVEPYVAIEFDSEGAKLFYRATAKNYHQYIAIVLDEEVISNPVVEAIIRDGRATIEGNFTPDEAKDLAVMLRAGALPADLEIVEERTVGPTLGKESLDRSLKAGILGAILVLIYMALYYRVPGIVADIALVFYVIFFFAALSALGATLTLPGIAGFILSVGMAVDANVIIFERIKEELRQGKTVRTAISQGFTRAFRAIFDANLTTLIAALILFYFGAGPIRGFAVTLSLGIVISMFTAIFVTKMLLDAFIAGLQLKQAQYPKFFGV